MAASSIVESDLAERQEQAPQELQGEGEPPEGATRPEQEPSAAHLLAELRASGMSLDNSATRSDIPRRTLDDILYGRSSGTRTLPRLRPLVEEVHRQQAVILPQNWTGPYVREAEGRAPRGNGTDGHIANGNRVSNRKAATAA
jgi:lambda repressor-like predicted transcriptional regulator